MAIGERIKYLRLKRGMTQQYLGEKAGFEPGNAAIRMAQYESGKRSPKEEITRKELVSSAYTNISSILDAVANDVHATNPGGLLRL